MVRWVRRFVRFVGSIHAGRRARRGRVGRSVLPEASADSVVDLTVLKCPFHERGRSIDVFRAKVAAIESYGQFVVDLEERRA